MVLDIKPSNQCLRATRTKQFLMRFQSSRYDLLGQAPWVIYQIAGIATIYSPSALTHLARIIPCLLCAHPCCFCSCSPVLQRLGHLEGSPVVGAVHTMEGWRLLRAIQHPEQVRRISCNSPYPRSVSSSLPHWHIHPGALVPPLRLVTNRTQLRSAGGLQRRPPRSVGGHHRLLPAFLVCRSLSLTCSCRLYIDVPRPSQHICTPQVIALS